MIWPIERNWVQTGEEGTRKLFKTSELADFQAVCMLGAAGSDKTHELGILRRLETEKIGRVVNIDLGALSASGSEVRKRLGDELSRDELPRVFYLDSLDDAMVPIKNVAGILEDWLSKEVGKDTKLRIACRSTVWPNIISQALKKTRPVKRRVGMVPWRCRSLARNRCGSSHFQQTDREMAD